MTQRERKQLLVACNAVLAVALAGAVVGFVLPLRLPSDVPQAASGAAAPAAARNIDPLNSYAVIYERDLRKPLFNAVDAPVVVDQAGPPLQIRLMGTAVEDGNSFAMFTTATGELRMVGIGETIDGAEVVAVTETSATVRVGGRAVKLAVEKTEGQP